MFKHIAKHKLNTQLKTNWLLCWSSYVTNHPPDKQNRRDPIVSDQTAR